MTPGRLEPQRCTCTERWQSCEVDVKGLARGDRKWPLNEGQIPNFRVVRVAPGAAYTQGEGNRRASRYDPQIIPRFVSAHLSETHQRQLHRQRVVEGGGAQVDTEPGCVRTLGHLCAQTPVVNKPTPASQGGGSSDLTTGHPRPHCRILAACGFPQAPQRRPGKTILSDFTGAARLYTNPAHTTNAPISKGHLAWQRGRERTPTGASSQLP
jgi:hypothetical protein